MKIENTNYVLMRVGNIEIDEGTVYLDSDDNFTDDIQKAVKAEDRRAALDLKYYYEIEKNHSYESDLKILPLKVTYEW